MSKKVFAFTSLSGSGTGALGAIDGSLLYDGNIAVGVVNGITYTYYLDDDSALAENSPQIIIPSTNPGTKRWILSYYGLEHEVTPEWFGAVTGTGKSELVRTANTAALRAALVSLSSGGKLKLSSGVYEINDYFDILNTALTSLDRIVIEGVSMDETEIRLTKTDGTHALKYDDGSDETTFASSKHKIEVRNLKITQTAVVAGETAWHPGTGIYSTARYSIFENVHIQGFTYGLHSYSGWGTQFKNVRVPYNEKGITVDRSSLYVKIDHCDVTDAGDSGTPANGYGLLVKRSGGVEISNLDGESSSSSGVIIEASHGVSITAGNFETYTSSRTIVLRGLTGGDFSSVLNWTTGVKIQANRFWNALGIQINDGVGWVDIDANTWTNNKPTTSPGNLDGNAAYCVTYSGTIGNNHVRKINYTSRNNWLHNVGPTYHSTAGYAHAFTQDGVAALTSLPSTGTFDLGAVIRYRTNRAFEWKCNTAGTYGTLNSGATTGTVATATDDQVVTLNSLTGIFPGAQVTIAGAGAAGANLAVTIGGVDPDTGKASFSPAATTDVTDAAVSYTTPVFALTGEDSTVQSLDYATPRSIDLSLGGVVAVATLGGNIELSNPTNGVTGQRFKVKLIADGSGRTITYGTAFRAGATGSLTASKSVILEFVILTSGAGGIYQINAPIEQ